MYKTFIDLVTDIANAIREVSGAKGSITVQTFGARIRALAQGVPQSGEVGSIVTQKVSWDEDKPIVGKIPDKITASASDKITILLES